MLPAVLQYKLATSAMASLMAASSPVPMPAASLAMMMDARTVEVIEVPIHDENHETLSSVAIARDGGTDAATTAMLTHTFRCKRTDHEHVMSPATLGMLADVSQHFHSQIELVSGYRAWGEESSTSPHRAARAIDFRILAAPIGDVRDYLWRHNSVHASVGVGWYPSEGFLHIDSRPGVPGIAWTALDGSNQYHPHWAEAALAPAVERPQHHKPGV